MTNTSTQVSNQPLTANSSQPATNAFFGNGGMIGRIAYAKTPCSSCSGSK